MNADQPSLKSTPTLSRVLGYLRPHRWRFAGGLGLTLLGIGLELLKPLPLAIILDTILGERPLHPILAPWLLGISGKEFLRRFRAGELENSPDEIQIAVLADLVR